MTPNDDSSLSEDELDEIVNRVVDQLDQAGAGATDDAVDEGHEIEVRTDDGTDERTDDEESAGASAPADEESHDGGESHDHGHRWTKETARRREDVHSREREAMRRAREAREAAEEFEDLGDRIEAAVEARIRHLGEHLEHALGPGPMDVPEPPTPGVVIGPDDAREKAVYKTQLQKGGRVAVPDTEIEALGLEPGDALQVVLYPVE